MRALTPSWVIIDCADPERLASFWASLLGVEVRTRKGPYVFLERTASGLALGFQQVRASADGKNRLHLDLVAEDLAGAVRAVEEAGGRRAAGYEAGGFLVMEDPEHNVFCLLPQGPVSLDETGSCPLRQFLIAEPLSRPVHWDTWVETGGERHVVDLPLDGRHGALQTRLIGTTPATSPRWSIEQTLCAR